MKKKWIAWLPPLLWMAVISCLSSIPNLHLANDAWLPPAWQQFIARHVVQIGTSGFFSYQLSLYPDFVLHKIGHVAFFGILGILWYSTAKSKGRAILLVFACAALDEGHQFFVAGRSARMGDILLDTISGMLFIWLWVMSCELWAKRCGE